MKIECLIANKWKDFELLDMGDGEKLERWGEYILRRPDPQILWPMSDPKIWESADAVYHRSEKGGGSWEFLKKLPEKWIIKYGDLSFFVKLMQFKHTGLFPEQAVNWDFMMNKIKSAKSETKVLNLFGYTGGATLACASAGAIVTHVDASKGMVYHASDNAEISGLKDSKIRWIVDDVMKFVERELKRGNKYEGIVMDPPPYGKGTNGETWRAEDQMFSLIEKCSKLLSENPLFFIVNTYTSGFSGIAVKNMIQKTVGLNFKGEISCGEIGLQATSDNAVLPCGVVVRFEK